jgi:hypothetical protein
VKEESGGRRYSDEELRRILADAAEAEVRSEAVGGAGGGHTLAEIRALADEVGIDPAAVDRAAARLAVAGPAPAVVPDWFGLPRLLQQEHVLPRQLTNAEMRLVALQAERVLGRRGALRDSGDLVEWRDIRDRLYVGVAREYGRTRIRAVADQTRELVAGGGLIGLLGASTLPAVTGLEPLSGGAAATLIGAATFGLVSLYSKWRSSVGVGQLQDLLDILEDAVRGM